MDKSIFFMTLAMCAIWLIVDSVVGKDMVGAFLKSLFPSLYE